MRTEIIAECSTNHCGDISLAKEMIKKAAIAGADIVKFQSFKADHLVGDGWNRKWYKQTELSENDHADLIECCKENNVTFLTTCFDRTLIRFLSSLDMPMIKVASTDLTSYTMLKELREKFQYMIVSTGMSTTEEIQNASKILKKGLFTMMHCVSIYPTPFEKLNLSFLDELKLWMTMNNNFNGNGMIGFSDHSLGIEGAKVALSKNIFMLEKHFTLDKTSSAPDTKVSIDFSELYQLCRYRDFVADCHTDLEKLQEDEMKVKENYVGRWGDNK